MKSRYYGSRVQHLILPVLIRFYPDELPPQLRVNSLTSTPPSGRTTIGSSGRASNHSPTLFSNRSQQNSPQWIEGVPNGQTVIPTPESYYPIPPRRGIPLDEPHEMNTPINTPYRDPNRPTSFSRPFEAQPRSFASFLGLNSSEESITSPGINTPYSDPDRPIFLSPFEMQPTPFVGSSSTEVPITSPGINSWNGPKKEKKRFKNAFQSLFKLKGG
jgi:hypothetical protein